MYFLFTRNTILCKNTFLNKASTMGIKYNEIKAEKEKRYIKNINSIRQIMV